MGQKPHIYTVEELVANERFQNYCNNTHPEDVVYWEDIILGNWNQRSTFEQAYNIVHSLSDQRIFDSTTLEAKVVKLSTPPTKTTSVYRRAVVAAVVLICGLVAFQNLADSRTPQLLITQSTNWGETKCITMPDGSTAHLNSNSSITYPAQMDIDRKVQFAGEVYFDVETTPDRKHFTVHGSFGEVEVTGTSFNLKHRAGRFEATLVEGAITYRRDNLKDIRLTPEEQLVFENNKIKIRHTATTETTDWLEGRMIYKAVKLSTIIASLSEDYGLNVEVENEQILQKTITANMYTSDPRVLLKSIGAIYDFKVEESEENIILK